MAVRLFSWGEQEIGLGRYAPGYVCPICGWPREPKEKLSFLGHVGVNDLAPGVVGFVMSKLNPYDVKIGILIIKCPRCFKNFWFHVDKDYVKFYRERCSNWPRKKTTA